MPTVTNELPKITTSEAAAIIAVAKGEADAIQQQMAFAAIIEKISCMYDVCYVPTSSRDTDFCLGLANVGQVLVGIIKAGTEPFRQRDMKAQQTKRGKHV